MFRNSFLSSMNNFTNKFPFGVPNIGSGISNTMNTVKALNTTSKLSLTGILDNASKTINTIKIALVSNINNEKRGVYLYGWPRILFAVDTRHLMLYKLHHQIFGQLLFH